MKTMQDIRAQYPEYEQRSDQELADAFHKKYYSSIPKEQFYSKIGFKQEHPKPGKFQSFIQSSEAAKENALYGIQDVYQDIKGSLGYEDPQAKAKLAEKVYANKLKQEYHREQNPWSALGGDILGGTLAYAPLAAVPGIGQSAISKGVTSPVLRNIGVGASQGVTQAGIEGALQYTGPEDSRVGNASVYGATGGLIGAGTSGILSGIQELQPSRFLRGNASAEQLMKNVETTRGTNSSLGGVLEHPGLMKFEQNVLSAVPLSGYNQSNQQVNNQINQLSQEFIKDVANPDLYKTGDTNSVLQRQLKDSASKLQTEKRAKYKHENDLAEKFNLEISDPSLAAVSKRILDQSKNSTRLSFDQGLIKDAQKFSQPSDAFALRDLLSELFNEGLSPDEALKFSKTLGLNHKEYSLENQNLLTAEFGKKARMAQMQGDDTTAGFYGSMKDALRKDINDAIENSPIPELKNYHNDINEWYKENIVPLKEPEIRKHLLDTTGKKQDKIFNDIVKFGLNQDQSFVMDLFARHFDNEGMQRLRQKALTNDNKQLSQSISEAYRKLGDNQKKVLFKDAMDKIPQWERISELRRINPETNSPLANPLTGQRLLQVAGTSATAGLGALMGGPLGAGIALASESAVGYALNKALRSEKFRENLVKKMVKDPRDYDYLNQAISSALARYVPLSSNEKSSTSLKQKQGKSVEIDLLGEY